MNGLEGLLADLTHAAGQGAQLAGHLGVRAGEQHATSGLHELEQVQSLSATENGPLGATVTATQPAGITPGGPQIESSDTIAGVMAHEAAEAATRLLVGKQ